jgi:hypothetical protein
LDTIRTVEIAIESEWQLGNSAPGSCEKIDGVHRSLTVAALKAAPNQSRARQQAAGNAAPSIFSQLPGYAFTHFRTQLLP